MTMEPFQSLIAFDIGTCNLAYCRMDMSSDSGTYEIVDWPVVKLREPKQKLPINAMAETLLQELDTRFHDVGHHLLVLIENQPTFKNPTMKSIQMIIFTYFLQMKKRLAGLSRVEVKLTSPGTKLKVGKDAVNKHGKQVRNYRETKDAAVLLTSTYLHQRKSDVRWREMFEHMKKKDDLADCFLMCIHHIETCV